MKLKALAALPLIVSMSAAAPHDDQGITPRNFDKSFDDRDPSATHVALEVMPNGYGAEPVEQTRKPVANLKACFESAYWSVKQKNVQAAVASCEEGGRNVATFDCETLDAKSSPRLVGCALR